MAPSGSDQATTPDKEGSEPAGEGRTEGEGAGERQSASAADRAQGPAREPPADSGVVERVRVEGTLDREPLLDSTSFSTVILREDLDRRMLDLPEALRATSGVQVRAFGGLGEFATVSIRGSSSEQVEIYLDGVPQRPALGGGVNLADLPSLALERVEVYRGFTPAAFGPASLAGAVSIRTRAPGDPSTDLRLSYGSFDTARLGALASSPAGPWDLLGALEVSRSDGDFGFFATDHPARRRNNGFEALHLLGRAHRPLGEREGVARLEVYNSLTLRDQGVPGFQTQPTPDASFELLRDTLQVGASLASAWGGWSSEPALYATSERQRYANPTRSPASDEDTRLLTLGVRAPLVLRPGSRLRWTLAPEVRRESARRSDAELEPERRFEARRDGFFASGGAEWQIADGRLRVAPALRWTMLRSGFDGLALGIPERTRSAERNWSGKLGMRWDITKALALKANAGRFFREPGLTELYGNSGLIQGASDLSPERGVHADLGLSWARGPAQAGRRGRGWLREARLEGSIFLTRAEDLILLLPTGGGTVKPHNSGRARIRGSEISGTLAAAGGWSLDLAYTRQRAIDTSGLFGLRGKILPGRPVEELHAGVRLERGRWAHLYRYSFIAGNYTDRLNTRRIPDRHLHTLGVSFSPTPAWEISFEAENLADQRVGDLAGFPLPGRMVTARLRFRP